MSFDMSSHKFSDNWLKKNVCKELENPKYIAVDCKFENDSIKNDEDPLATDRAKTEAKQITSTEKIWPKLTKPKFTTILSTLLGLAD